MKSSFRIALPAAVLAAQTLHADCVVTPIEVVDRSRTVGIPYASPADSGATFGRVRTLVWTRGTAATRPTYAALIRAVAPGVDAAEHLTSRLRFYGATVDSSAVALAVSQRATCAEASRPTPPRVGVVIVLAAFPAVMYEGAAAALAERDIATVVTTGSESSVRLIVNHLATLGWPVDKIVLVGHGAGGSVANLVAMSSSSVRALVSLDGFEALDRRRHPGLTGDPGWRPGNLRAPVLHWRPAGHPDADTSHYAAAARSALVQITLMDVPGKQWMTAPEVALAPRALQSLVGATGASVQDIVTRTTVRFIAATFTRTRWDVADERLPSSFSATERPALATPAIRTDGRLDEAVWRNARVVAEATSMSVRVAEDCDYLYAAVMPRRAAPFITELFIGRDAPALTDGHLLLHASASLCWAYGKADVAASDCNKSEAWWGGSRSNQAGDPPVGEYVIAKRAVGLARCEPASGLRIGGLAEGWGRTDLAPDNVDKARPGTWAKLDIR